MIADHHQHDRQGQVIVVQRALLGQIPPGGIGHAARDQVVGHLLLVRDDDEEDVGRHDGAEEGADVDIGRAPTEDLRKAIGRAHGHGENGSRQQPRVLADLRATKRVIAQPAEAETAQAEGNGRRGRQGHHRWIDEELVGADVIDDAKQQETRDPGEIGLVFEPVQLLRQGRWRHQEFPGVIEAAAVNHPAAAGYALGLARLAPQAGVEPDEMKRGADPGDAQHHMGPAQQQPNPIPDHRAHRGFAAGAVPSIVRS